VREGYFGLLVLPLELDLELVLLAVPLVPASFFGCLAMIMVEIFSYVACGMIFFLTRSFLAR
jgi:hypothetical protein